MPFGAPAVFHRSWSLPVFALCPEKNRTVLSNSSECWAIGTMFYRFYSTLPPKKNKLEQSVTTTSDSSEILLVDFLGVYNLAILQSPQPTNRLQRTKAASVCCHAGSTWGMRGTCTLHRWTDQMKVIYLWLYLRFDGDMMGIWWGMEISWFLLKDLVKKAEV